MIFYCPINYPDLHTLFEVGGIAAAAAQSRTALEEQVGCRARPSGGVNSQKNIRFCSELFTCESKQYI